jgi:hypothetical protein
MNAICLVVDRLHAGYLGAYGNTWIDTPNIDRLASQSAVFDQALVDSPQLERLYRSYWQGWHALCPPSGSRPGLAALLRSAGVATTLLTDDPQVARHPLADEFDELVEIDPPWQPKTADNLEQSHFGRSFVETIDWLQRARGPFLLWCHLGSLGTTWDAPVRFREAYQEPGDPPPPDGADVPEQMLPADYDPDQLLGVAQSYAGQVTMFDACLGAMIEYFDSLPDSDETLLALISPRGFPLGEHRRVGPCDNALFGELVHVPWMLRFPQPCSPFRSQALIEPADLWATLLEFWGVESVSPTAASVLPIVHGTADSLRDRLCIAGSGSERAIRTPAWYLRTHLPSPKGRGAGGEGSESEEDGDVEQALAKQETGPCTAAELYAKPDDRWEANDVANRCRDVVEELQQVLSQYEQALPAGQIRDLPPISDVLRNGLG